MHPTGGLDCWISEPGPGVFLKFQDLKDLKFLGSLGKT